MSTSMNKLILHIPHASTRLPRGFYNKIMLEKEKIKIFNKDISDLYVDDLFGCGIRKHLKAKYSRIFCDMEKFVDDTKEEMSIYGMGVIYTHTNNKEKFLCPSEEYKKRVISNYYFKYHKRLDKIVKKQLTKNRVILIDCHSFSKKIIMHRNLQNNLPDICIGFDSSYYSEKLISYIKSYFEALGYSVKFNYPYSGTMIPYKFIDDKVDNLYAVMIEINKSLYLDDKNCKTKNYRKLKKQIYQLLKRVERLKF